MDYNWLENVPTSVTPIPVYQPDFTFLQSMQMKADQQYEQGLKEVKTKYDSIFNKAVTDESNVKKQQEYKKQALDQMKAVAATDLGDPKNVMVAENIMAPFHEDRLLLQDQVWTSQFNTEYQRAYGARDSSDEKVKRTFDEQSLEPIQYMQEKLRNAGRNPDAYKNISVPSWTPFIDIDNYLSEWKIKEKPEISWEDSIFIDPVTGKEKEDPTRIHHHVNGPKSLPGWYTTINGKVDKKFDPQYNVLGTNAFNRTVRDYISTHKGATEEDAKNFIASSMYKEVLDQKKAHMDNISTEVADNTTRIKKLRDAEKTQLNGLTKKQKATLVELETNVKLLTPALEEATTEYNEFSKPDKINKYGKNYIINQLANTIRQQDIGKYSKAFSADTGGDAIRPNEAYFSMARLNEERRQHDINAWYNSQQLKLQEEGLKIQKQNADINQLKAIIDLGGKKGSALATAMGYNIPGGSSISGSWISSQGTDKLKSVSEYDIYNNILDSDQKTIGQNLYGTPAVTGADKYGSFSQLLVGGTIGFTPEEKITFDKYQLMNHYGTLPHTPDGRFKPASVRDGEVYNSAINKLRKGTGLVINTPDDATKALIKYGTDWAAKGTNDGSDISALKYYSGLFNNTNRVYTQLSDELSTTQKSMTDAVNRNPEKYKTIAVKNEGQDGYHMISNRDIEPYAFDMTAVDDVGNTYTFTKSELAKKYVEGKVNFYSSLDNPTSGLPSDDYIKIDGKVLYPTSINNKNYQKEFEDSHGRFAQWTLQSGWTSKGGVYTNPRALGDAISRLHEIKSKFNSSSKIAQGLLNIGKDVIAHSDYYKKQTGIAPTIMTVPITGDYEDYANYVKDALETGNRYSVEDETGSPVNDDGTIKKLQSLANNPKLSDYIGRSFNIVISDQLGTNKIVLDIPEIENPNDPYKSISGKKFLVAISPDTKSELLRNIPIERGVERFHPLHDENPDKNKVYANDMYSKMGINGILQWSKEENQYKAIIYYTDINPTTGESISVSEPINIPADKRAIGAVDAFERGLSIAARKKLGNMLEYNNKQGTSK